MRATMTAFGGEGGIVRGRTAAHPSLRSGPTAGLRSSPTLSLGATELNPSAPREHHARLFITIWRRGWDSNPRTPVEMLLEFQSSALDRSATSPINNLQWFSRSNLHRLRGLRKRAAHDKPCARGPHQPSGRRRRLAHLEGWRRVETGLAPLARRRSGLVERGDAQRAAGLGAIEPGGNLERRHALRVHVRLRRVTGVRPQNVAAATRQQKRREPEECSSRSHSQALTFIALDLIRHPHFIFRAGHRRRAPPPAPLGDARPTTA